MSNNGRPSHLREAQDKPRERRAIHENAVAAARASPFAARTSPISPVLVREYRPEDFEAVKMLHQASLLTGAGPDYRMPDLDAPLFVVKKVVERDGRLIACGALRIEAEGYLWCGGSPRDKMEAMAAMQPVALDAAWSLGIDNVVCWIPRSVESRFEKRLRQLGWEPGREGWHSWSRNCEAVSSK